MQNTWRICHGKKAFDKRVVWDKQRKQALKIDIIYEPVWHPEHPDQPRGRYMKYPKFKML